MATVVEAAITPEDLLTITDRPMPELVDGELVEREPMGQKADAVAARIIIRLGIYSESIFPGLINTSQGSFQIFPDDPNKVRIPDASFTRLDRLPGGEPAEGHGKVAPDLVVEVISPSNDASGLMAKIDDYLAAGVPWIWVVDPDRRIVLPIGPEGSGPILRIGDVIRGGDVLPGFECPVASFFVSSIPKT